MGSSIFPSSSNTSLIGGISLKTTHTNTTTGITYPAGTAQVFAVVYGAGGGGAGGATGTNNNGLYGGGGGCGGVGGISLD